MSDDQSKSKSEADGRAVDPLPDALPDTKTAEQKDLVATAYHEAGHAVAAFSLGRPIEKVTIAQTRSALGGLRLGVCKIQKGRTKSTQDWLEDEVIILFAGMVAESNFTGNYCEIGAAQDLREIRKLLSRTRATKPKQLERLEQRLLDKTEHLLGDETHAQAVELIAQDLLEKETIKGRAVQHWFRQSEQQNSKS